MDNKISYNIIFPNNDQLLIMMDTHIAELDSKIFNNLIEAVDYIEQLITQYPIVYKVFYNNDLFLTG